MRSQSRSELRFDGRVAVVTGAGRGMGLEMARLLAARGAQVVVNDYGAGTEFGAAGDASVAEAAAASIVAAGGDAVPDSNTVATEAGGTGIVSTAIANYGRLDIVVHNAGLKGTDGPVEQIPLAEFEQQLAVHCLGALYVVRAAWPQLVAGGAGRIIGMSSGSIFGWPHQAAYGMAKAAQLGLIRSLAAQGASVGVHANAVMPVAWSRLASLSGATPGSPMGDNQWSVDWLQALGDPTKVAPAVAWLAHADCDITGELISAGAGRVSRAFIGDGAGYVDQAMTIEDVRDHWDEVVDESNYRVHPTGLERMEFHGERTGWAVPKR